MAIKLGPVLRFNGSDGNQWKVSAMLVTQNESQMPEVKYGPPGAVQTAAPQQIMERTIGGAQWRVIRYDISIAQTNTPQKVSYNVQGLGEYSFNIPAIGTLPRCGYASCNGFSDPKLMKKVTHHQERWEDLNRQHDEAPYHLLMMGGDQVYSDEMWCKLPSLEAWSKDHKRFGKPFTAKMEREVSDFFFQLYVTRWSQTHVSRALSTIPTLMMWDDHDIFDGWGSYPNEQQNSPVYQGIFNIARDHFVTFQLQGASASGGFFPGQEKSFNGAYQAGKLGILVLDMRSERSSDQVISQTSWDKIYGWLNTVSENQFDHLFVMSSIPVVHADFNTLECLLGAIPGQQELEDDLRDHWQSRPHRTERIRLIRRLLDFATSKKCRVTLLSGDVHLAAVGTIESDQYGSTGNAHVINQLTSSGIVHPSPNAVVLFFLNQVSGNTETVERGVTAGMSQFPGTRHSFIGARNWLSLEPDDPNGQRRYWANWRVEGEAHPFTKAIHPA